METKLKLLMYFFLVSHRRVNPGQQLLRIVSILTTSVAIEAYTLSVETRHPGLDKQRPFHVWSAEVSRVDWWHTTKIIKGTVQVSHLKRSEVTDRRVVDHVELDRTNVQ